jgi:hypothetical protein
MHLKNELTCSSREVSTPLASGSHWLRSREICCENASPDGENRDARFRRWERETRENQPLWTALTPEEYEAMAAHTRANETTSQWQSLGREAGFGRVRELFVAPTDLFRMYCFQA